MKYRSSYQSVDRRFHVWVVVVLAVAVATAGGVWALVAASTSAGTAPETLVQRTAHAYDDPTSYSVVVNKQRPLSPIDYAPEDLVRVNVPFVGTAPLLRSKAASATEALFAAFHSETGLGMQSNSAYRSYADQKKEFARFSGTLGTSEALETTARPGYSEHQTGLAIDIGAYKSSCTTRDCFAATPQAHWLATNAWRFGFIIRYPLGKQSITGYTYEPWHIRFVGKDLAKKIHGHYPSLESYFGLPAAPDYS